MSLSFLPEHIGRHPATLPWPGPSLLRPMRRFNEAATTKSPASKLLPSPVRRHLDRNHPRFVRIVVSDITATPRRRTQSPHQPFHLWRHLHEKRAWSSAAAHRGNHSHSVTGCRLPLARVIQRTPAVALLSSSGCAQSAHAAIRRLQRPR